MRTNMLTNDHQQKQTSFNRGAGPQSDMIHMTSVLIQQQVIHPLSTAKPGEAAVFFGAHDRVGGSVLMSLVAIKESLEFIGFWKVLPGIVPFIGRTLLVLPEVTKNMPMFLVVCLSLFSSFLRVFWNQALTFGTHPLSRNDSEPGTKQTSSKKHANGFWYIPTRESLGGLPILKHTHMQWIFNCCCNK